LCECVDPWEVCGTAVTPVRGANNLKLLITHPSHMTKLNFMRCPGSQIIVVRS